MEKFQLQLRFCTGCTIIVLAFVLMGNTGPNKTSDSNFTDKDKGVSGWIKKQHHKTTALDQAITSSNLAYISQQLQSRIKGKRSLANNTLGRNSLQQTLSKRGGQLIHLQSAREKAHERKILLDNIRWRKNNGTPAFISGNVSSTKFITNQKEGSVHEMTLALFTEHRDIFQLDDPASELQVTASYTDHLGKQHLRFQQRYNNVPIWGHDLAVHFNPDGSMYAFNAHYSPTPRNIESTDIRVTKEQAIGKAISGLAERVMIEPLNDWARTVLSYNGPSCTKYIWSEQNDRQPHLVWHVEIRPNFRDCWYYFIDTQSGKILQAYNATNSDGPTTSVATDLNGNNQTLNVYELSNTYYMLDASRSIWQTNQPDILNDPKGGLLTLDAGGKDLGQNTSISHVTSNNNTWSDRTSVSAHSNVGEVFQYYFGTHNRRGIDGKGSTVISVIHVTQGGQPMDNAFWNGAVMAYGDGNSAFRPLAGSLDVAAHEMTHGVIQHTVGLEYKFQSGALNESLADIFGVMVDREDWQLGEDVVLTSVFPSGALRDMQDPHNGGSSINDNGWQPAHMDEFLNLTINEDNGGVHINSGIPNRACFLMGDAIGKDKTEKIYYRLMDAGYLNSQSSFIDMRLAAIRAATDLYNDPSAEVSAVKAAFNGVGITDGDGTPPPGDLPSIEGDQWIAVVNAEKSDSSLFLVKPELSNNSEDIRQLTTTQILTNSANPISVSDDGSIILFIDYQNFIRIIRPDGTNEQVISQQGVWSSIALSPNAARLAVTSIFSEAKIYIFDLKGDSDDKIIDLYSPTTGEDIKADIVQFADALDWDFSGQFVLYDAFNKIPKNSGEAIEYWDVNILDVANEIVIPIFPPQSEGINVGNPSFSQTNDNFFVFDLADINAGNDIIYATDLFHGKVDIIEANGSSIGFPKYSPDDSRIVFQRTLVNGAEQQRTLRQIAVAESKIKSVGSSVNYITDGQLPAWFAIGTRSTTGVEENEATLPTAFSLQQNVPNPFNPETSILFELPMRSHVSIKIFDIKGSAVASIKVGEKIAGGHQVHWDGRDLNGNRVASGVYIYRLEAKSSTNAVISLVKKMTLFK